MMLHRLASTLFVDTTLSVQGLTLPLVMTVETTATFSGFNEPVTIEAPELGA